MPRALRAVAGSTISLTTVSSGHKLATQNAGLTKADVDDKGTVAPAES